MSKKNKTKNKNSSQNKKSSIEVNSSLNKSEIGLENDNTIEISSEKSDKEQNMNTETVSTEIALNSDDNDNDNQNKTNSNIQKSVVEKNQIKDDNLIENSVDSKEEIDNAKENIPSENINLINKSNKKVRLAIIIGCIVVFSILLFFAGIAIVNKLNPDVYKNVYVLGINMSGKDKEQVYEILDYIAKKDSNDFDNDQEIKVVKEKLHTTKFDVYQGNENIYSLTPDDLELSIDAEKTAHDVISYGRNKGIFLDNINILSAFFTKKSIDPVFTINDKKLQDLSKNIELTLKDRFVNDTYSIDKTANKLLITRGKSGNTISLEAENDKIKNKFIEKLTKIDQNMDDKIVLDIVKKKPETVDLDQIYKDVKIDPKDAYIDKNANPIKLVAEEKGYDINITDVKALIEKDENKKEGVVIEVPLVVIEPKVKLADITYTLYKDKLSGYTTYFENPYSARGNNLKIALDYLNGKVIMPGQTFSYNAAVGDVNAAKGYKEAATFKGGTVVQELGGGICQTTSTLYNVALMANLEIVERHQHGLPVGYVPPSRDATVYSPVLDFKFKNNRKYPVKIVTSFSYSGSLNISIYGTKEETEYEVILSNKYLSTIPFTTKYEYDENMNEGEQVIISAGVNGYTSEGYITKKLNGQIVSSDILSKDKYNPQQQIVKIGTKKQ